MQSFAELLTASWARQNSLLCVGLDPVVEKIPRAVRRGPQPLFNFNREIIDAVAQWVCAFKPQIAHYAARAAEDELVQTIDYVKQNYPHLPVILDAKRGDIAATAKMYAEECFARYNADAVTVNPYLGGDSLSPFLEYDAGRRGVFILCRTSNPGGAELQALTVGGKTIAQYIALRAANEWNANGNVGLVAGATWPKEIAAIRTLAADLPLLIPGVGAQGGELAAVMAAGQRAHGDKLDDGLGDGLIINLSRAILYAADADQPRGDFAAAARAAAKNWAQKINACRQIKQP